MSEPEPLLTARAAYSPPAILLKNGVHVVDLTVESDEVRAFLEEAPEEEWADRLRSAIQVGVAALERVFSERDLEYVRQNVERLLTKFDGEISALPAKIEAELVKKLGVGPGQVLQPVRDAVTTTEQNIKGLFAAIDPATPSTVIGQSLKTLKDTFDPTKNFSVQRSIADAIAAVTGADGALSASVKQVVSDAMQPYQERVDALFRSMGLAEGLEEGERQLDEFKEASPASGTPFEEQVFNRLSEVFGGTGCEIEWQGVREGEKTKRGDIVMRFAEESDAWVLVIEAKSDTSGDWGAKPLGDYLEKSMQKRAADRAIFVAPDERAFNRDAKTGHWFESRSASGPWIATTFEQLIPAVRLLRVKRFVERGQAGLGAIDTEKAQGHIREIARQIENVRNVNTHIGQVKDAADKASGVANALRHSILRSLNELEAAFSIAPLETVGEVEQGDDADLEPGGGDVDLGTQPRDLSGVREVSCAKCGLPLEVETGKRGRPKTRHDWCR